VTAVVSLGHRSRAVCVEEVVDIAVVVEVGSDVTTTGLAHAPCGDRIGEHVGHSISELVGIVGLDEPPRDAWDD
jgi:hypothetical protein